MKGVLSAVEEEIRPVDCGDDDETGGPCPSIPTCGSRLLWKKLEAAIDRTLSETTLEELCTGPKEETERVRLPSFPVSI
ncbi:MAG: hypothetical protein A3J27_02215 [Candidatus Tectomicrobia bacterium RIFCSPLOWO2_12_FULL_69_37]|nr:MAG: hypothetical protein A3J27_02215 [Candidatus Tectomicrobia bacterium RIFCSPLOWO2_12_FULL_69_37]